MAGLKGKWRTSGQDQLIIFGEEGEMDAGHVQLGRRLVRGLSRIDDGYAAFVAEHLEMTTRIDPSGISSQRCLCCCRAYLGVLLLAANAINGQRHLLIESQTQKGRRLLVVSAVQQQPDDPCVERVLVEARLDDPRTEESQSVLDVAEAVELFRSLRSPPAARRRHRRFRVNFSPVPG